MIATSTYLLGLSLLLATSFRGWYITGHDIQEEYRVFELTKGRGVWNIASFATPTTPASASRSCPPRSLAWLASTILTSTRSSSSCLRRLPSARVPAGHEHWSKDIAILGVVYFVGFPTFFTDMPYLNRQEMAFIFLGLAFLAMTRRQWTLWRRRTVLVVCALGIGLQPLLDDVRLYRHLGLGLGHRESISGGFAGGPGDTRHAQAAGLLRAGRYIWGVVVAAGLMAFVWGGTITRTASGVSSLAKEIWPPTEESILQAPTTACFPVVRRLPSNFWISTAKRPCTIGRCISAGPICPSPLQTLSRHG